VDFKNVALFQLQQFVPSSICLKCDGCCRVNLSDSPWRPKVGQEEPQEGVDLEGYVQTLPQGNHRQCVFFNKMDNTCGVYAKRPFECALYPFVLSQSGKDIEVYVHLACPYVQDNEINPRLQEGYVEYLKEFFNQPRTKAFLKRNGRMLHDYKDVKNELRFLFTIEA